MSFDFYVRRNGYCEHCKRNNSEELFHINRRLFVDAVEEKISYMEKLDSGKTVLRYIGAPKEFSEHIEACEYYSGEDALQRLEKVRPIINSKYYRTVQDLLKKDGAYMYASW